MRQLFLLGAAVVRDALADPRVAAAWPQPSVLEEQTIGSLAGHLARGGVWVVGDYLAAAPPGPDVDIETAAEYFADIADHLSASDHRAIRDRGAAVAADGHGAVLRHLDDRLAALAEQLADEPAARTVAVYAGKVMRLDDYLWTRLVEQVVHLDDLARSLDVEPWRHPPDAAALVIACGAEIGRLRRGDTAMIRTLFREGFAESLPVL